MASGGCYRTSSLIQKPLSEYERSGFPKALLQRLMWAARGSFVHQVSNCEDVSDWDIESSGDFNAVNETSSYRTGSNALELVDVSTTKGTCVTLDEGHRPNREDWRDYYWLGMWIQDDTALRLAGELTFQIRNNGDWSDEIAVPLCQTATVFEMKCIDISGVERGCVDGFRFVNRRGTGSSEKVYVDSIFVTDLITGTGDGTQVAVGPVRGRVIAFPGFAGETLNPGECANWEKCELTAGVQNDTAVVGIVCQNEPVSSVAPSDSVPAEVLIAVEGSIVYLRNDSSGNTLGDHVIIASGNVTAADGTTNLTKYFARSLETGTANADTGYMLRMHGTVT